MGTVVLKSTVSAVTGGKPGQQDAEGGAGAGAAAAQPGWAELANDIVVNEKVLLGSRCGGLVNTQQCGVDGAGGAGVFPQHQPRASAPWHALGNASGSPKAPYAQP